MTKIITSMRLIQSSPAYSNYDVVANLQRHIDKPLDVTAIDETLHSLIQRPEDQFDRQGKLIRVPNRTLIIDIRRNAFDLCNQVRHHDIAVDRFGPQRFRHVDQRNTQIAPFR